MFFVAALVEISDIELERQPPLARIRIHERRSVHYRFTLARAPVLVSPALTLEQCDVALGNFLWRGILFTKLLHRVADDIPTPRVRRRDR